MLSTSTEQDLLHNQHSKGASGQNLKLGRQAGVGGGNILRVANSNLEDIKK